MWSSEANQHLNCQKWSDLFTSKKAQNPQFFTLLTSKCASRHNGVHFFDIATSKSGPELVCFVHFDLEMCFAPQRRALFRHRNFQKWSGPGVFCTFWLGNVLRATTACTFSTSQLVKVVRSWCVLYILTWKCAPTRFSSALVKISVTIITSSRSTACGPTGTCCRAASPWMRQSMSLGRSLHGTSQRSLSACLH